jgi:hypothetical protein
VKVKFYVYWFITELSSAYFLLEGMTRPSDVAGFFTSHATVVGLTMMIYGLLMGTDRQLRSQVMNRGFIAFLLAVCVVPVIGPAAVLFFCIFLRFYPIYPVRSESFHKIDRDVLLVLQKTFEGRSMPVSEALLIRGLTRAQGLKMVGIIGEMDWSATKSGLLKYITRLSTHQSVVLMAIDLLNKKTDAVLSEIAQLESHEAPDRSDLIRLASLYHEICYLDLADPVMKPFYASRACDYAIQAFHQGKTEDDALFAVRYLLEADRVEEADRIYRSVRAEGDYYFPKWITYEFELAFRSRNYDVFNDLALLIESGGGVFIPDRVKEAATAWRRVLTSAWL